MWGIFGKMCMAPMAMRSYPKLSRIAGLPKGFPVEICVPKVAQSRSVGKNDSSQGQVKYDM